MSNGSVGVEKFVSQGNMTGEEALSELFDRFSESESSIESSVELSEATGFATLKQEDQAEGLLWKGCANASPIRDLLQ